MRFYNLTGSQLASIASCHRQSLLDLGDQHRSIEGLPEFRQVCPRLISTFGRLSEVQADASSLTWKTIYKGLRERQDSNITPLQCQYFDLFLLLRR